MKTSDAFKNTIQSYLEGRAATDELFAVSFAKEGKTIDNCINYILTTVQNSGCNGFTDDEVFGMAVHYYDEDQIEVGAPVNGRVVVNHTIELTEADKAELRENARNQFQAEALAKMKTAPKAPKKAETPASIQTSLF